MEPVVDSPGHVGDTGILIMIRVRGRRLHAQYCIQVQVRSQGPGVTGRRRRTLAAVQSVHGVGLIVQDGQCVNCSVCVLSVVCGASSTHCLMMLVRSWVDVYVVVRVALRVRVCRPAVFVQVLQEYVARLLFALVRGPIVAVRLIHRCLLVGLLDVAGVVVRPDVVMVMVMAKGAGDGRDRWKSS